MNDTTHRRRFLGRLAAALGALVGGSVLTQPALAGHSRRRFYGGGFGGFGGFGGYPGYGFGRNSHYRRGLWNTHNRFYGGGLYGRPGIYGAPYGGYGGGFGAPYGGYGGGYYGAPRFYGAPYGGYGGGYYAPFMKREAAKSMINPLSLLEA